MPHRLTWLIALALALGILFVGRAEASFFDQARDAMADAFRPVTEILAGPIAAVRNFIADIDGHIRVHEENQRLKEENARLLAWKAAALRLERQLERYNALLNVQLDPGIEFVTGRVVAEQGGPFVHTLIVNAGQENGVRKGQAVVDGDGLVGRIIGAGRNASRVLLLSDLNSRIPVMVEETRQRGILAGANRDLLRLQFLEDETEIEPHFTIVTSGAEGMLPPGLPVGTVVRRGEDGWLVQPYANRRRVDYVRILNFAFPRTIDDAGDDGITQKPRPGDDAPPVSLDTAGVEAIGEPVAGGEENGNGAQDN